MADKKPKPMADLALFLLVLVGLGALWVMTGGPERAGSGKGLSLFTPKSSSSSRSQSGKTSTANLTNPPSGSHTAENNLGRGATSTWYGKVRLRRGSWSSVTYPFQEYIYIDNITSGDRSATATISGWKIMNRGRFTGYPDQAVIPSGVRVFVGGVANKLEPIKLAPRERAIVNTGRLISSDPYQLPSAVRVNKCFGYFNTTGRDGSKSSFYPNLHSDCDQPLQEPGAKETLNDDCLNFIKKDVKSCMTLKFNEYGGLIGLGKTEVNDRDGKKRQIQLDSSCLSFLRTHYNYNSCVAIHKNDRDFFEREWRVWLGLSRKLYAPDREVITLYDKFGKIVDQLSY